MAKNVPNLFHNRSATQDFLVSHTDDTIDANLTARQKGPPTQNLAPHSTDLPDLLDRQGLETAIDARMAATPALCVMAIHIEQPTVEESENDQQAAPLADSITPLATHSGAQQGLWGRIGPDRYACVLADTNEADAQALAERLLEAVSGSEKGHVTIGLAVYPTINYSRRQTVANAEKALDHGSFFGPGTVTRFGAVSLNISGDRCYQSGEIDRAIDEFKKGLMIDPTNANLHNSLGVCYGVLKDYDSALTSFENANWLAPEDVMAIYNKGYVLLLTQRLEAALACLLEANAREPDVFEVVFHIGQIYMEMDQPDHARGFLEAATRANSRSGAAFKNLGACLDKLGLTKEAIQAYKSAVKINPEDAPSLSTLGRLYTERGESLDVAAVLCEQSVRLEPENGLYRYRLARTYLTQDKLEDALAAFEAAAQRGHDCHDQIEATQRRLTAAKAS